VAYCPVAASIAQGELRVPTGAGEVKRVKRVKGVKNVKRVKRVKGVNE
jgi:hypothetical protein